MKKGKFQNGTHFRGGKVIAALLAVVLLVGATIGGTIAWLTASTKEVENTFTVGNIDIALTETTEDYKMIPGYTIDKDPVVTVKANSEDCWVFIQVTESIGEVTVDGKNCTFNDYISYEIDSNNWTQLTDNEGNAVQGVYVQTIPSQNVTSDRTIKVLQNNQVQVKDTVTKQMMDVFDVDKNGELSDTEKEALPKLTFTAYAVQLYKSNGVEFSPAEAWAKANSTTEG